jgi:hypothetical protein
MRIHLSCYTFMDVSITCFGEGYMIDIDEPDELRFIFSTKIECSGFEPITARSLVLIRNKEAYKEKRRPFRRLLSCSGSGAGIRTQDLQVMRLNPKMGTLDRQAGLLRVAV